MHDFGNLPHKILRVTAAISAVTVWNPYAGGFYGRNETLAGRKRNHIPGVFSGRNFRRNHSGKYDPARRGHICRDCRRQYGTFFIYLPAEGGGGDGRLSSGNDRLCGALFLASCSLPGAFSGVDHCPIYGSSGHDGTSGIFSVLFSSVDMLSSGLVSFDLAGIKGTFQAASSAACNDSYSALFGGGGGSLYKSYGYEMFSAVGNFSGIFSGI